MSLSQSVSVYFLILTDVCVLNFFLLRNEFDVVAFFSSEK